MSYGYRHTTTTHQSSEEPKTNSSPGDQENAEKTCEETKNGVTVYGEIVSVTEQHLTISEELGYKLRFYHCKNEFNSEFRKGDTVLFNGVLYNELYKLIYITRVKLNYCSICLKTVNCVRHVKKPPNQRIKGIWEVKYKQKTSDYTRLWFNRGVQAFAYSCSYTDIQYRTMSKLQIGHFAHIKGWLGEKAQLKYVCRSRRRTL